MSLKDYEAKLEATVYQPLQDALEEEGANPLEVLDTIHAVFLDAACDHHNIETDRWDDKNWKRVANELNPIWDRKNRRTTE